MATSSTTDTRRKQPTLEITRARESPASRDSTSGLCARCLNLPLENGFTGVVTEVDYENDGPRLAVKIDDVGKYYRQPSVPGCDLCQLLCNSRITIEDLEVRPDNSQDCDELYAFDVVRDSSWVNSGGVSSLLGDYDSRYLAVVPSGAVFNISSNRSALEKRGEKQGFLIFRRRGSPQPEVFTPRPVPPRFDVSLGKAWLQHCKRHHKRPCSEAKAKTMGLRLIDCHALSVISAPREEPYAALSYLWGGLPTENGAPNSTSSGNASRAAADYTPLPKDLPAAIKDAIKVTIELGLNYLWIDKYCIDQDNKTEKHGQISQMDSIYRNSEITIIAAAGHDPTYGLPGMDNRPREQQSPVTIRDITITPTLANPQLKIRESKWSTRGWTLQEAVLSRRRLVFTDDQVYFECQAMNCHESLYTPLERLHVEDGLKFLSFMRSGIFSRGGGIHGPYGDFDKVKLSAAQNLRRYLGVAKDYTSRDLTMDNDSLNAFSGIIRDFEASENSVRQIYGIPFLSNTSDDKTEESFICGLAWHHEVATANTPRPRRRKEFPSWSWAGWAGEIRFACGGYNSYRHLDDIGIKPSSIEWYSGLVHNFPDVLKYRPDSKNLDARPPVFHAHAIVFPSSLLSYDDSANPPALKMNSLKVRLAMSIGPWDPKECLETLRDEKHRLCVFLGVRIAQAVIMVLQQEDNNIWSRAGLVEISMDQYGDSFKEIWSKKPPGKYGSEFKQWLEEQPKTHFRIL